MATFYIMKTDAKSHPNIWRELQKHKAFKNARAAYGVTYDGKRWVVLGTHPTLKQAEAECHKYARDRLNSKSVEIIKG